MKMTYSHRQDEEDLENKHSWLIEEFDKKASELGRFISWEEAHKLVRSFVGFRNDDFNTDFLVEDWLRCTELPVIHWEVVSEMPVAWGNFPSKEEAEEAVKKYQETGPDFPFTVKLVEN